MRLRTFLGLGLRGLICRQNFQVLFLPTNDSLCCSDKCLPLVLPRCWQLCMSRLDIKLQPTEQYGIHNRALFFGCLWMPKEERLNRPCLKVELRRSGCSYVLE